MELPSTLLKLTEHHRIQLVWVLGHMGVDGAIVDQLARQGCTHPLTRPEPALGIYVKVTRGVIRGWMSTK